MIYQIKKDITKYLKKNDIPEILKNDGIVSYEEQAAIVSQYLHLSNNDFGVSEDLCNKAETILSIWANALCMNVIDLKNDLFVDIKSKPFYKNSNKFTFIDLFAGIGGFRMAFQNIGGTCVFSSELNTKSQKTYYTNYGDFPFGDITLESTKRYIPDEFDILCAGFPCQPFSIAGQQLGFEDTRGTLFFEIAEILKRKQPKAFLLENVKGLVTHDKHRTFNTILSVLDDVGYTVPTPQIIDAMYFGVPQHRERIYIVGFRKDLGINPEDFHYPEQKEITKHWIDVREPNPVPSKYYITTMRVKSMIEHRKRNEAKGNGFGYRIIPDDGIANTIVTGGMGRDVNIIIDKRQTDLTPTTHVKSEYNHDGWRNMTPREWGALQGFPVYDNGDGEPVFIIYDTDGPAYKQFANSVAVPAIQATAQQIINTLNI